MRRGGAILAGLIVLATACGGDAGLVTEPPSTTRPPEPVRIMALGDSITDGPYYRFPLMDLLNAAGCDYDLVGSQSDVTDGNDRVGYDVDHEGYGGWKADQLRDGAEQWARAARPDIVLLHVGVNDLYSSETPLSTEGDIDGIIAAIRKVNPNVTVLLAQIIPGDFVVDQVDSLNRSLAILSGELDRDSARVILVDHNTGFDLVEDTIDDNVHPNEAGSKKMADRWFASLEPFIAPNCTT